MEYRFGMHNTTVTQLSLTGVSDFHYITKKFEILWTFDVTILTSN